FKLMAYKDEYEVARLHSGGVFQRKIEAMFEGDFTLHFHLAPPLLAKRNEKGELQKQHYGPALLTGFKLLARLKGLRGTALDIFGWTPERRQERALIGEYRASVEEVMQVLDRILVSGDVLAAYPLALEIARIPEQIKGFGHVKARHLALARLNWDSQMARLRKL
ncbi:MAG: indolepyruvate ferredoxin oxidoreductase family protein, partial [Rhodoferax sp.]|nr:indolepyruvate ferredoxin oxidoreductase family protein [Rhodoferax sp.]